VSFAEQIPAWHDFYATVAGLSETLVGLLFVGLDLNPRIIAADGPTEMRILAAQTFHNFLVLLVISHIALIPDDTAQTLAITLVIVRVHGVLRVKVDLRRARRDPDPQWRALESLTRYVSPTLAYAICRWLVSFCGMGSQSHWGASWQSSSCC
jgi:hypothetical protein